MESLLLTYNVANQVFRKTTDIIKKMIEQFAELDAEIIEFRKVSDLMGTGLDNYVKSLAKAGQTVSRTASEMVEAATMFRKNSFSDEDSATLATVAAMFQNVADTEISASDAASFIISQIKAFDIEAKNAQYIIDAVNETANNFAVGTNDLSNALEIAGAGLATYGNTYQQTIALVTSGTEILVGRSAQVARGLNTIAARITKNSDALKAYGIDIYDTSGELRSTYDILADLSVAWQDMTTAEKVALGQTLAGLNQYKVLAAVMTNFETAVNANTVALNASGSASEENARYLEGYEAKVNLLNAAFQNLSNEVVQGNVLKSIIGGLANIVQWLSESEQAVRIIQILLTTGAGWGVTSLLKVTKIFSIMGAQFKNLSTVITEVRSGASTLSVALEGVSKAGGISLPILLAIATAVTVIAEIAEQIIEYKKTLTSDYQNTLNEQIRSEIQENKNEIDSLTEKNKKLTEAGENYLEILKAQNEVLQEQLAIGIQERYDRWEKEQYKDYVGFQVTTNASDAPYYFDNGLSDSSQTTKVVSAKEYLQELLKQYENGKLTVRDFNSALGDMLDKMEPTIADIREMQEEGAILTDNAKDFLSLYEQIPSFAIKLYDVIGQDAEALQEFQQNAYFAAKNLLEFTDAIVASSSMGSGEFDSAFRGYAEAFSTLSEEIENGRYGSKALEQALTSLVDAETAATFASGDYATKVELIEKIMPDLITMFGNADSAGLGYLSVMKSLAEANGDIIGSNGEVVGTIEEVNGVINYSIEDLGGLAEKIGVSTGALFAMAEAGKVLGYEFSFSTTDIIENLDALGIAVTETADGAKAIDLADLTTALSGIGYSQEDIQNVANTMQELAGITVYDTSASVDDLGDEAEDAESNLSDIDNVTFSNLNSRLSTVIDNVTALKEAADRANASINSISDGGGESGGYATGTNYAEEGLSLVNEEGAEIIQSGTTARIANDGKPTITYLHKGDRVFNAEDTKDILSSAGNDNLLAGASIQAFALSSNADANSKKNVVSAITGGGSVATSALSGKSSSGSGGGKGSGSKSSSSSSTNTSADKQALEEFEKWQKAKEHALAMDEITEQEYYDELEKMVEKYLKNRESLIEQYWKYEEIIYEHKKSALEDEIELEEKLQELAKAKTQKVLVYKDGYFQYVQNAEAIASAQREVDSYATGTTSATGGLSLVGEHGAELRVLNQGDGILPASITRNLLSLGMNGLNGSSANGETNIYNIGSVELDNVTDVESLFTGLKNLAIQSTASRK